MWNKSESSTRLRLRRCTRRSRCLPLRSRRRALFLRGLMTSLPRLLPRQPRRRVRTRWQRSLLQSSQPALLRSSQRNMPRQAPRQQTRHCSTCKPMVRIGQTSVVCRRLRAAKAQMQSRLSPGQGNLQPQLKLKCRRRGCLRSPRSPQSSLPAMQGPPRLRVRGRRTRPRSASSPSLKARTPRTLQTARRAPRAPQGPPSLAPTARSMGVGRSRSTRPASSRSPRHPRAWRALAPEVAPRAASGSARGGVEAPQEGWCRRAQSGRTASAMVLDCKAGCLGVSTGSGRAQRAAPATPEHNPAPRRNVTQTSAADLHPARRTE
mmetsp:Transcript_9033/g.28169  ORF Transcript_9033/g.28169 Transcript_9033/m.28169 type:complete len:321 (-) Transcript_9033:40-1002(-)